MKANIQRYNKSEKIKADQYIKSPIKLTISLLVSNNIKTIRKCLDSIKPLLDGLPSELIIVDTVGEENSDGSLAIAREYTDKIVRFEWCNDFAAARNAGLKLAKGEWFLFLDDDEWFEDATPIINFLNNDDGTYNSCYYRVRNYKNYKDDDYKDIYVSRFARLTPDTIFIDKIHEHFNKSYTPFYNLDCYAHHYGYVFLNHETKMAKSRRNIIPLLEILDENPRHLRAIAQLLQEYRFIKEFKKERELNEKALSFAFDEPSGYANSIALNYLQILYRDNEIDALKNYADEFLNKPTLGELGRAAIYHFLIKIGSPIFKSEKILEYADEFFYNTNILDKDPDKFAVQNSLSLEECQEDTSRAFILIAAINSCENLKSYDKMFKYIKQAVDFGDKFGELFIPHMGVIVRCVLSADKFNDYCDVINPLFEKENILTAFINTTTQLLTQGEYLSKKWDCIKKMAALPSSHPLVTAQKLLLAEHERKNEERTVLLEEYAKSEIAEYNAADLMLLCYRNKISPKPLAGKIYAETWEATVNNILSELEIDEYDDFAEFLVQNYFEENSPDYYFLFTVIKFYKLKESIKNSNSKEYSDELFYVHLKEFSETNYSYYSAIENPANFTPEKCIYLKKFARSAFFLKQALDNKEQGKQALFLRNLRYAMNCNESLKAVVEHIFKKEKAAVDEMTILGDKIKNVVRMLLQKKDYVQAKTVLDSLKEITPDDCEVDELYEKLPKN